MVQPVALQSYLAWAGIGDEQARVVRQAYELEQKGLVGPSCFALDALRSGGKKGVGYEGAHPDGNGF